MLGKIVGTLLQNSGNGVYGEGVKNFYWNLKGKKTLIGVVSGALLGAIYFYGSIGDCSWCKSTVELILAVTAGLGVTLGQVDGALHMEPPSK